MFVKNFYKMLGCAVFPGSVATNDKATVKKPNGGEAYIPTTGMSMSQYNYWIMLSGSNIGRTVGNTLQNNINWGCSGMYFGSGTTKPTIDDYRLEGETIQNLSGIATATAVYTEETYVGVKLSMVITNGNSAPVTISEVGLFGGDAYFHLSKTSTSTSGAVVLLERSVLDKPVTIEPGGVGKIEYMLKMNFPTA